MLSFKYDRVVGFHRYRSDQPWALDGVCVLHVEAFNAPSPPHVRQMVDSLEGRLFEDARRDGLHPHRDNHYGYTVEAVALTPSGRTVRYQVRFSDGDLYVWLMPPVEAGERPPTVGVA